MILLCARVILFGRLFILAFPRFRHHLSLLCIVLPSQFPSTELFYCASNYSSPPPLHSPSRTFRLLYGGEGSGGGGDGTGAQPAPEADVEVQMGVNARVPVRGAGPLWGKGGSGYAFTIF